MTPVQAMLFAKALTLQDAKGVLEIINKSVLREVPPSEKRLQYTSADFINAHFNTELSPGPVGHGFSSRNIKDNVLYYTFKTLLCLFSLKLNLSNYFYPLFCHL